MDLFFIGCKEFGQFIYIFVVYFLFCDRFEGLDVDRKNCQFKNKKSF